MKFTSVITTFAVALLMVASFATPVFAVVTNVSPANDPLVSAPAYTATNGTTIDPSVGFKLPNPLSVNSICGLIKRILDFVLAIGSPIAALFLVWAGFKFVIARGNPKAITGARSNIINVIMGIAIFLAAWLLGQVIANTIKNISPQNAASATACS